MAHPDLDDLLNVLFPRAEELLEKYGEFFPFGAAMDIAGGVRLIAGYTGSEQPPSDDVIAVIVRGMRHMATKGEIRASGHCADVRVIPLGRHDKVDGIRASLEHRAGDCVEVFLPYRKHGGTFEFGEVFAGPGDKVVFAG